VTLISINPSNAEILAEFEPMTEAALEHALRASRQAQLEWSQTTIKVRSERLLALATVLRQQKQVLSRQICEEMGKLFTEAQAEVEKCALTAEYYAAEAETMLRDQVIASDAHKSLVALQPLGTVLAVMPWNFPLWQVMRCAIPATLAGNSIVLKHSSNSQLLAQQCQALFDAAGFPAALLQNLCINSQRVADLLSDQRIHAVSVTGSETAGRAVAAVAGAHLKKCVLELGGSDAFVVLDDAQLESSVATAVQSRFINCGQSCIAAKRFIVTEAIAPRFVEAFHAAITELQPGDPMQAETRLAPMAREDLRQQLDKQLQQSLSYGAQLVCGGKPVQGPG
jgi:succinate-semialdehyde dehydrogenase/glutarate-semialdehyde dehydrogenase